MGQLFLVEYNERPSYDYLLCRTCRTRVTFVEDYIAVVPDFVPKGLFNTAFNVEVPEEEPYHQAQDGITIADTYCVKCGNLLGWKFIAVSQCRYYKEGEFLLILDKISYWNDLPLVTFDEEVARATYEQFQAAGINQQDLGANEDTADQNGSFSGQVSNGQDLGANVENAYQNGTFSGLVPYQQNLGANAENADQDEDSNEPDLGATEENADQDGGDNEQVPNQDADIAEGMGNIDLNANT